MSETTDQPVVETPHGAGKPDMIVLEGVEKIYPGSTQPAVSELDLAIPQGEIVMLIGPSGCGKTTTLKMINRLIEPTSGRILLDGKDVTHVNGDQLRREIGYVIQQGGLFPHFSIADNIGVVPKMLGWDKQRIRERADELLHLVGLEPSTFRDRYPRQLSGGQQQRVGVARALAADPPVMLMDEPFGAIDPITRERLQEEFLDIQRTVGKTIAFVTHDLQEAVKLGDKIAVFATGRLEQYADPDTVLTRPANDFVSDFVGGGAAVRRLSLVELAHLELHPVETDEAGTSGATGQGTAAGSRNGVAVAEVDGSGRPVSWRHLPDRDAAGTPLVTVPISGSVYDAVDVMLDGCASLVAVVDEEGRAQGVLHWNDLVGGLRTRQGHA
ncbi:ABC transporter ATP-binding protein [Actinomycetospora cinnamomea]|uniref:ABC-type quaternary amine transporter n=1 Tax=Actinomycetospora cinnamomea TaxID=663609 RepID=A0A2U1FBV2_9PSEU|nr:osmoprotectant transport system ATP-binding protein [Actinomycetospora cinnamomea]